jgi:uncharacterized protein
MSCEDTNRCCAQGVNEGPISFPGTFDHDTPWRFYNHLIKEIPEDIRVLDCCVGSHWTYIEADCGMGLSFTCKGGARRNYTQDLHGMKLMDVAELVKSWNYEEASLGVAALNAWYAQEDKITALGAVLDPSTGPSTGKRQSAFTVYHDQLKDKKVAVVGHFPHLEQIAEIAELTILERNCTSALDTPDPACEYLLPSQDFVFITGVTIINKTAPRLLDLCANARTIMVGPSVIPTAFLYHWGIETLAGSIVNDPEKMRASIKLGAGALFEGALRMFQLSNR